MKNLLGSYPGCFQFPAILVISLIWMTQSADAQLAARSSIRSETSLAQIPASVGFYAAFLMNRQQFDAVANSKAVRALLEMPVIEKGIAAVRQQWTERDDDGIQLIKSMLDEQENQELIQLLIDAVSHEVFVAGNEDIGDVISMFQRLNNLQSSVRLETITTGQDPNQLLVNKLMEFFLNDVESLQVPVLVLGFKSTRIESVNGQIARLEMLLRKRLEQGPELSERIVLNEHPAGQTLTVTFDGTLIPWDDVSLDEIDADEEKLNALVKRIKELKLSVSLATRDSYLLMSFGPNTKHLDQLGKGSLLADRPELAPVSDKPYRPYTSVTYVSEPLMKQIRNEDGSIDDAVEMARQALSLAPIGKDKRDELSREVQQLGEGVKSFIPAASAVTSLSYLVNGGYEGYSYTWTNTGTRDAGRPLTILNHVGGNPLMFYAQRATLSLKGYDLFAQSIAKLYRHAIDIGQDYLDEEESELLEQVNENIGPLLKRLDKANRELIYPSVDGQGAIVLDTKATSKRWVMQMPDSEEPLPMMEIGIVSGLKDADQHQEGCSEYLNVLREVVQSLSEIAPEQVPTIPLPGPEEVAFDGGKTYRYQIPLLLGVDSQIAPNASISDDYVAYALLPSTTQRLIRENTFQGRGGLASIDQNLASVWQFNFAKFVEALSPWVKYGMMLNANPEHHGREIHQQIETVMQVLRCFDGATGIAYDENRAFVQKYRSWFKDLP